MAMGGGLFGVAAPRPRGSREENLLGINTDVGLTDADFQVRGRAPVDELFAGRNSAWIDDKAWDELEAEARDELIKQRKARGGIEPHPAIKRSENLAAMASSPRSLLDHELPHNTYSTYIDQREGSDDDAGIRRGVTDETGLHMYPGQGVKGSPEDAIFMYEFSDSGASLADGWRDAEQMPGTLGGILDHPELYKHYPELRDLPLEVEDLGPRLMGSYGGINGEHGLGRMSLNSAMDDSELMKTILHETQHYIQRLENWPGGGGHGAKTTQNFATWHPGRSHRWDQIEKDNPNDNEDIQDARNHEAYENISGEILARDVEDRYGQRNNVESTIQAYQDPKSVFNMYMSEGAQNQMINDAAKDKEALEYYPSTVRDRSNAFPHNMPVSNPIINPYVMRTAMAARHDNYGIRDQDTIDSYYDADSLFEEAMKEMKKREGK